MKKLILIIPILFLLVGIVNAENETILSNCIEICDDSDDCICPKYCQIQGIITEGYSSNCGGQPTSCGNNNMNYWERGEEECQYTCGNYDNDFMKERGYNLIDYDCFRYDENPEPVVVEEKTVEKEIIPAETTPIIIPEISEKKSIPNFVWIIAAILIVAVIFGITKTLKKKSEDS